MSAGDPLEVEELDELPADLPPVALDACLDTSQPGLLAAVLEPYLGFPPAGVEPRILVARRAGKPRGVAALAHVTVFLDCLAPAWVQRLCERVRRLWAGFFRIRVTMVGLPSGLGSRDLAVLPGATTRELAPVLAEAALAASGACHATVVKELDARSRDAWGPALRAAGFLELPSVPTVVQAIEWESLDGYRSALRAPYRRQLTANLAKARGRGLRLEHGAEFAVHASDWYELFLAVLARSETRLETLSAVYFRALARRPGVTFSAAFLDGQLVGGTFCLRQGETLHFLYVGMDYQAAPEVDLYFNLLHGVLELAIRERVRTLRWGQTSLDAKGRLGGLAEPLWFYLRFASRLLHLLVGWLAPVLFPARRQLARRVFR